jgi:hypothetical protein
VFENLEKHLDNEALWNYLRGFFPSYKIKLPNLSEPKSHFRYEDYPEVQEFCKKIVKQEDILEKKKIQTFLTISIIDSQQEETMKYAKEVNNFQFRYASYWLDLNLNEQTIIIGSKKTD